MVTRINNRHLKITTVRLLPVPTYTAFLSAVTCPLLSGSSMTSPRLQPTQTLSHTLTPSLSHTQRRVTEFMYTLHCQAIFSPQPGKSHYRQLYFRPRLTALKYGLLTASACGRSQVSVSCHSPACLPRELSVSAAYLSGVDVLWFSGSNTIVTAS